VTSILVFDGGSSNVAAIKAASHGCHGAYSVNSCEDGETNKYSVEP